MNDIDYDSYMEFWRDSIENGTLEENTDSLPYVKYNDDEHYDGVHYYHA